MDKKQWYESVAQKILDNIVDFYQEFYQERLIGAGSGYRLNPCPNCGHKDCCTIGETVHCFSCKWAGTHINAFFEYMSNKENRGTREMIKMLEDFSGYKYPSYMSEKDKQNQAEYEKVQSIRSIAVNFYQQNLFNNKEKFPFKQLEVSPLQYQTDIRKHTIEALESYKVGFVCNYLELRAYLMEEKGFSKEEIKDAKIWFPEGTFIYPYFHPITKDIVRLNIKNPFNITMKRKDNNGNEIQEVVKGLSTPGVKIIGFSPNFNFRKPILMLEGENDSITAYEEGFTNNCWLGGRVGKEHLEILDRAEKEIYCCFDNDEAGKDYHNVINEFLPHKTIYRVEYNKNFEDIDDYYKNNQETPESIEKLIKKAKAVKTTDFKIFKNGSTEWVIANRHRKLEFRITGKDNRGGIVGQADYYEKGKLKDREEGKTLSKCKSTMKPFNFYLSDEIEKYFNVDLDKRNFDELIEIYKYCSFKSQVIKMLASVVYKQEAYEELIQTIKIRLGDNVCDAILKEVNDLQNIDALKSYINIPKIKLSQYFNCSNNDAYFYFTCVKKDGEALRKLPFLLRNDGQQVRLDLLKRKDSQCLLLVDNKYELPFEVSEAKFELTECSLSQDWADKFSNKDIHEGELNPYEIVKSIEKYIKKFYRHVNTNVYKVLALYIYGTYFYELFQVYPYLFINGGKGSGKTLLDTIIYLFALNAKHASDISDASLFRMISTDGGTVILDEMEHLTSRNKSLESGLAKILKSGYANSSKIYRFNQEKNVTEGFDVYSPKIISNIFGVEDVIEDRCIRIDSYKVKIDKKNRLEDPLKYKLERLDEIKEVTSKCCLSALLSFQLLNEIHENMLYVTDNARLSQILTPLYSIAAFVDLASAQLDRNVPEVEDISRVGEIRGEYTTSLNEFYESNISKTKQNIEENTPEGIIKDIVTTIALECIGVIPENEKDFIIPENHRYTEEIEYSEEEGYFVINALHLKCFMEEHLPGEIINTRVIPGLVKTCFDLTNSEAKRRMASIENDEELQKDYSGAKKLKVYYYKFWIRDFVDNDFLETSGKININEDEELTDKEFSQVLF